MSLLIVFDLDGTLIDSARDLAESTNEMLVTYGARELPLDAIAAMVGEGARKLVERALAASDLRQVDLSDALTRFRAVYDRRLLVHTRPYDGIPDVVREAAALGHVAVLTNKPEAPARRLIEAFDWQAIFRWVIGGDSSFPRKPDPASLLHLMREAGAAPQNTILVGDSMVDVETGRRAGAVMCVATYGFGYLRGELALDAGEHSAATPADVGHFIREFANGAVRQ